MKLEQNENSSKYSTGQEYFLFRPDDETSLIILMAMTAAIATIVNITILEGSVSNLI